MKLKRYRSRADITTIADGSGKRTQPPWLLIFRRHQCNRCHVTKEARINELCTAAVLSIPKHEPNCVKLLTACTFGIPFASYITLRKENQSNHRSRHINGYTFYARRNYNFSPSVFSVIVTSRCRSRYIAGSTNGNGSIGRRTRCTTLYRNSGS